jgi:small subunit ribosomal protein S18
MQRLGAIFLRGAQREAARPTSVPNFLTLSTGSMRAVKTRLQQQSGISSSSYMRFAAGDSKREKSKKTLGPKDAAPEEFFDQAVEDEKQLFDMVDAMAAGVRTAAPFDRQGVPGDQSIGLQNLTLRTNTSLTFDQIDAGRLDKNTEWRAQPLQTNNQNWSPDGNLSADQENFLKRLENDPSFSETVKIDSLLQERFESYEDPRYGEGALPMSIPREMLNSELPWRMDEEHPDPEFAKNFLPTSSPELFRHDQQGLRTCEGKKQRQGAKGELNCHIIDLQDLSHFDVPTLRRFITSESEIMNRKSTGLCAKCQRRVATTIKRARQLGVLAHNNEFVIKDQGYQRAELPFHADAEESKADFVRPAVAKTIL